MRTILLGLSALFLAVPAGAQRQPTPEQRIERLERQTRQIQRQVFPRGQPADTAGVDDTPAASQVVVVALSNRIDALERQLAEATRLAEENGNRVATLETELARVRTDFEERLRRLETGPAPAAAAETTTSEAPALGEQPREAVAQREPEPAPPARPARTGNFTADGEAAYEVGFRLWEQRRYREAIAALRAMASSFPGHRRVSWANNLAGRALLDSGQPRAAAEALLANYRGNPRGERAADSLFYLGQALMAIDPPQPQQACKAYAELEEVYGTTMRAELRRLLPAAKTRARC